MFPGLYPIASHTLLDLLSGDDASEPSPAAELLADTLIQKTYLLVAEPWDPLIESRPMLCLSSDGYASDADGALPDDATALPHQLFRARLAQRQVFNVETRVMSGGELTTDAVPSFGTTSVIIADNDGAMRSHLRLDWRGARLRTYLGRSDLDLSQFLLINKRFATGITADTMVYRIESGDLAQQLRRDVQTRFYRGMGSALRFNGTTAHGSGSFTCPAGSMAIELWCRPTSSASTVRRMFGWRNGSAAGLRMLGFSATAANRCIFEVRNDAGTLFSAETTVSVAAGAYVHLMGILDADGQTLRLIVHDDSLEELADIETAVSGAWTTVLGTAYAARNESSAELLPGELDEIRVWSYAPTEDENRQRLDREIAADTTDLEAYYKANDAPSGTQLLDSTANAHHLNLTNHTWVGSLTGGPSLAGQPIPRVWGRFSEWEPVVVDETFGVYQINDGPVEEQSELRHRGLEAYIYDGDVADVYASTPASGHWTSCDAKGIFRLVAMVDGRLTMRGKGDNTGGYVEDAAGLVMKISQEDGGLTVADLDNAAFSSVSAAYPYPLWIGARLEAVQIWSLLHSLMDNIHGRPTITREGYLSVFVLDTPGTATLTLNENDLVRDGVRKITVATKPKQTRLGYARYGVTQNPTELSSSITSSETRNDFGQEFRFVKTPLNTSILAGDADAPVRERFTSLAIEADASEQAMREQEFWSSGPVTYLLPLTRGIHQYKIGDDLKVLTSIPLEGLEGGFTGTVVAFVENVPHEVSLEAIGVPVVFLADDDFEPILGDDGEPIKVN